MDEGFTEATSDNLPKIDAIMVAMFLSSNRDFCSECSESKPFRSPQTSYGDDAISQVQLKRVENICTVKAIICPDQVCTNLYQVILIFDENVNVVLSVECPECFATRAGCEHALALLMWLHRRSEDPVREVAVSYWQWPNECMTVNEIFNFKEQPLSPPDPSLLTAFLAEAKKRKLYDCMLLRYSSCSPLQELQKASLYQLVLEHKEENCDIFLNKLLLTNKLIKKIEEETRGQNCKSLRWDLMQGRITSAKAYRVSQSEEDDEFLTDEILGAATPVTKSMNRKRLIGNSVKKTVELKLGLKIKKCGLMLSQKYPMIAGMPDGVCDNSIITIKCPSSIKLYKNYFTKSEAPRKKYYVEAQIDMFLTGKKNCFFCVADAEYSKNNKKVEIFKVPYNYEFVTELIEEELIQYWKEKIYPLLYNCCKD